MDLSPKLFDRKFTLVFWKFSGYLFLCLLKRLPLPGSPHHYVVNSVLTMRSNGETSCKYAVNNQRMAKFTYYQCEGCVSICVFNVQAFIFQLLRVGTKVQTPKI